MVSASSIKAGAAFIELYLKDGKAAAGLRMWSKKLKSFGASATAMGKSMLAASAAMSAPLVIGAKAFADLETQMAAVSTMLAEPEKHLEHFKTAVSDMAVEFGESTETLSKGLYDILSASVPAEKALAVLAVSARAAKAGMTDTGTAADAITTVLNSYGLAAENAGDVSDWLFSIVKKGKTTFGELAPSIGNVTTIAAQAGVGLDELGAMIATLTRNGIKTDNALTSVNAVITSFLKPSKEAAQYAAALGLNLSSATLESDAKLPPDAIAKLFPNIRAIKGILPALKDLKGFAADTAAMAGRTGATEEAYAKMAATLSHAFGQVREAGLAAFRAIGGALAKPLAKIAVSVKKFAKGLADWISKNQGLVVTIAKVTAAVGAIGAGLVALGTIATAAGFALSGLATIVSVAGTVLGAVAAAIGALISPVGLAVAAIVGLGVHFAKTSGVLGKAVDWISAKFAELAGRASTTFGAIGKAFAAGDLGLAVRVAWAYIKMEFTAGINATKAWLTDWKHFFANVITEAHFSISSRLVKIWYGMQSTWTTVSANMQAAWAKFSGFVVDNWTATQRFISHRVVELMALVDDSFELEEGKKAVDDRYDSARKERQGQRKADLKRIKKDAATRQAEIEANKTGALDALEDNRRRAYARRQTAQAKQLAEQEKALADAKAEWEAAVAKANALANEAPKAPGSGDPAGNAPDALAGVDQAVRLAADSIRGSFSIHAFRDQYKPAAQKAAEQTAKNTADIAESTRAMAERAALAATFA